MVAMNHIRLAAMVLLTAAPVGLAPSPFTTAHQSADDWSRTARTFQQALASGNPEALEKSAATVAADNTKRAVDLLLKGLRTTSAPSYWTLIAALAKTTSEECLVAIGDEVLAGKIPELRRDLIMSLRLCEGAAVGVTLRRILKDGTPDLQVSAMDEIVDRLDVDAVPILLDIAEKDPKSERELTYRIYRALQLIGHETPKGPPSEWRAWWKGLKGLGVKEAEPQGPKPSIAGKTITEILRPLRSTQFEDLKKGAKDQIVVMSGEYDSVEDVLSALDIPHTIVSFASIKSTKDNPFGNAYAVFINCAAVGDWPEQPVQRVREYVGLGGGLFVSDLGVSHLIRHAFPGYMHFKAGALSAQTVDLFPSKGITGHPLMRGVEVKINGSVTWQIDEGGPTLQFDDKKVVSLIESPDLSLKRKPSSLAVTFSYVSGKPSESDSVKINFGGVYQERQQGGRVLLVLSHFKKQQREDGFALQNLLINFLIEAKDRRLMREDASSRKR
jgi:hypothetical protein